jgi:hypothetical protein
MSRVDTALCGRTAMGDGRFGEGVAVLASRL